MRAKAAYDLQRFSEAQARLAEAMARPLRSMRCLDVGCGQRYSLGLLLATLGNKVTGIDTDKIIPLTTPMATAVWQVWRADGLERALYLLVRRVLRIDRRYFDMLESLLRTQLNHRAVQFVRGSITKTEFPNARFDIVVSVDTFEHIADVPAALRELRRICRPGALLYVVVHPYPCLSGGHNPVWQRHPRQGPGDALPWGHLRGENTPTLIYLNRWRIADYLTAFAEQMEILRVYTQTEGEVLLTPQIERVLSPPFSREDLLTRELAILARRPFG
jgi:SAM-dependent methyltransferase